MSLVFKNNYENNILIKHISLKRKGNIGDTSPKIKKNQLCVCLLWHSWKKMCQMDITCKSHYSQWNF